MRTSLRAFTPHPTSNSQNGGREKAASQLKWIKSEILRGEDIAAFRKTVVKEETEYQRLVAEHLDRLTEILE